MPKVVDSNLQREDIRAAARKVFASRGVRGTGLAHVAEAAGMGRSSLYHYYPDKRSLLADMVGEMLDQERAVFRVCLRGEGTPQARLDRLARACAALFPEWADTGRMILDRRLEDAKKLRTFLRGLRRELAAVIEEGQADGSMTQSQSADVLASILMDAIDGLLLQYFVDPKALPAPDRLAANLAEGIRRMVAA
jgi:AcrR family transcriptional regulator